jgi:D-sedoheptulose 7-phosphate isomerase
MARQQSVLQVRSYLAESGEVKRLTAAACAEGIASAADVIAEAFRSGGKLLLCGNGGSAADCQHMAAEFVSRLTKDFDDRHVISHRLHQRLWVRGGLRAPGPGARPRP